MFINCCAKARTSTIPIGTGNWELPKQQTALILSKQMLHCGADIYKRDTDGRNAVEAVFQNSNTKVLKALLKNVPLSKKLQVRYRVCTATKKFPKSNMPRIFGTFEDGSNLLTETEKRL